MGEHHDAPIKKNKKENNEQNNIDLTKGRL